METREIMVGNRELLINMGPQHPSTHGVLRLMLGLEGETIVECTPHVGYLHRGIEKLAEYRTYPQVIPLTDRLDYVASMSNNLGYVLAVEKLFDIKVPHRCNYIRTIVAEMTRIASHLLYLGVQAMDIGAITVIFYCFREREALMDLFEMLTGARLTVSYMRIGGVKRDISQEFIDKLYAFVGEFPHKVDEYDTLLKENRIWLGRTKGIGIISAEEAISYGLTGPNLRGSGIYYDLRKLEPYCAYDQVDFDIPIGKEGDVYDRYLVRIEEMRQSCRIIKQALDKLPKGPIMAEEPKVIPPGGAKAMDSIENLIHHFYIISKGAPAPVGEVYAGIEAPRGELGFYIVSNGDSKPYRLKIRAPSFINIQSLKHIARGHMIADMVACIGSLDPVMGESDR